MRDTEAAQMLRKGAKEFNAWREENDIEEPDLEDVNLLGIVFTNAKNGSEYPDLRCANLQGANLTEARLDGANLIRAKLEYAKLYRANLHGADLRRADLRGADLVEANLRSAKLQGAKLRNAKLCEASLRKANLSDSDLSVADFSDADLKDAVLRHANVSSATLTNAALNENAVLSIYWRGGFFPSLIGGQVGVNGVYAKESDSAALMDVSPPGNSMLGSNADAVVASLDRARKLHGVSLGLVLLGVALTVSDNPDTTFVSFLGEIKLSAEEFYVLSGSASFGILTLVTSFLGDALDGARHLRTRDDAMTVGLFPWAISRYTGPSVLKKAQSYLTRISLAFHPVGYLVFWEWEIVTSGETWYPIASWHEWTLLVMMLVFSTWIYIISQQFQRPILFDSKLEKERKTDMEKLSYALDVQTEALSSLVARLAPDSGRDEAEVQGANGEVDSGEEARPEDDQDEAAG